MKETGMASAAEQMAVNLSWGALGKATDLRHRIFVTLGLLIVYRLGTYIPVPGIDGGAGELHFYTLNLAKPTAAVLSRLR